MSEGDILVRGTEDPMRALELLVAHLDEDYRGDDMLAGVAPPRPGIEPDDYELDPAAIQAMADWCHTLLANARPGWYRKIHCLPHSEGDWEGWSWQLGYANGPARGAFQGVYFRDL
ncbi:hypothetical protein [Actinophytocola sp.]|uniref:hypothetical protein n=1 Tax=Actinophytocola sp. TaxID=1872138 RepID=UPI002DB6D945|nr:hypothetical protein [Actinophytocola sp.]